MSIRARFSVQRRDFSLDLEFQAPGRGVTAIFGPSGCGKTTLLRHIAGLEYCVDAELEVNGSCWQRPGHFVPVHQRALGYVFQEPSLFAHLSVIGNLRYAIKRRRGVGLDFDEVVELLGIEHLLARHSAQLSGGERQRIAIARALLAAPSMLLMDEPLAALDLASRQQILPLLERLHQRLDIPVLYVSHAPDEVARLADHLLLLERGRLVAQGPLNETLARMDSPLSQRDEAFTVLNCQVAKADSEHHLSELRLGQHAIYIPRSHCVEGDAVRLRIQARDVSINLEHAQHSSILNILPATVLDMSPPTAQGQRLLRLAIAEQTVLARVSELSRERLGLVVGMPVFAQIKAMALLS